MLSLEQYLLAGVLACLLAGLLACKSKSHATHRRFDFCFNFVCPPSAARGSDTILTRSPLYPSRRSRMRLAKVAMLNEVFVNNVRPGV
jgi:hypothetical protein